MKANNNVLSGANNKRLNNVDVINSSATAAYADVERTIEEGNVPIPSENDIVNAKEWVDNGSKL